MREFLCSALTAALLLTSALPTFAASSVNMEESDFTAITEEFAGGMSTEPTAFATRQEAAKMIFGLLTAYVDFGREC